MCIKNAIFTINYTIITVGQVCLPWFCDYLLEVSYFSPMKSSSLWSAERFLVHRIFVSFLQHTSVFFQFVGCFNLLAVHLVRYFTIIVWTTDRLIFITIILSLYNWSWAVFRSVWTWAVIVYLLKFDEHFVGVQFENINAIVYKILRT